MERKKTYYFKAKEWFLGKPVLRDIYLSAPTKSKEDIKDVWAKIGIYLEKLEEISEEEFEKGQNYEI